MINDKIKMLDSYIRANVGPIIISNIDSKVFSNIAIIIQANISKEELIGKYENDNFKLPLWYRELINNSNKKIIIINNFDSISKTEQLKFHELLKYRKIGNLKISEDVIIILIANNISSKTINENIYSLLVHIEE